MKTKDVNWRTFDEAVQGILQYFAANQGNTRVIYFDGWRGFAASTVLRAVADEITSQASRELRLDKVVHIDCSAWKSRRAMQRTIALQLKLDTSDLDKADEEDDFNGVDEGSRSETVSVAEATDLALRDHRFMVVFHNGSGNYIDLGSYGIPQQFSMQRGYFMLWTLRRRLQGREGYSMIEDKVKNTHFSAYESRYSIIRNDILHQVLLREAIAIANSHMCLQEMDQKRIICCCMYGLFLNLCLPQHLENTWAAQASNYWMCDDGIIQDDHAWEIGCALSEEIKSDLNFSLLDDFCKNLIKTSSSSNYFCSRRLRLRCYPWVAITISQNLQKQDIKAINEKVSSCFLAPGKSNVPLVLADGLFNKSTNLHVLQLSYCLFSFATPPFTCCQNLRFLGLDHCEDSEPNEQSDPRKWQFLQSLRVLNLIYTSWYQVFSKKIADLLVNLRELNIGGVNCSHVCLLWTQLQNLYKLQIINPATTDVPEKSIDVSAISTDVPEKSIDVPAISTDVPEIIDLSGNKNMKLPSTLKFFSLDNNETTPRLARDIEVSLKGCTGLKNLLLRRLSNLVELDLSGTAIKILDFTTMVVEVSCLKRLYLLGCSQLCAIKWDNRDSGTKPKLELLCIDTRPGIECPRPSLDMSKSFFSLHVHAVIVDARLARSLSALIWKKYSNSNTAHENVSLNIHVTSSTGCSGAVPLPPGEDRNNDKIVPVGHQYYDVLSKVEDTPMQTFPQPPFKKQSRNHFEIAQGSRNLESELDRKSPLPNLAYLVTELSDSLHVHDVANNAMSGGDWWHYLKWCRIERCHRLETIFPADAYGLSGLETIWVSDLLMAQCIWRKGSRTYSGPSFRALRQLHLCSCPRLQFVIPVWVSSFPSLEAIHVIHCSSLRNIFVPDGIYPRTDVAVAGGLKFPRLRTICLHDLPMLRRICGDELIKMVAPMLEAIKIKGCWDLRRLPAVAAGGGRAKPAVEMEKDVWDALEWDGVEAGHHPSLFEAPRHSRYYRKKLPRVSVLR